MSESPSEPVALLAAPEIIAVVDAIKPILGGRGRTKQGVILAYLTAIYLAGHEEAVRPTLAGELAAMALKMSTEKELMQ